MNAKNELIRRKKIQNISGRSERNVKEAVSWNQWAMIYGGGAMEVELWRWSYGGEAIKVELWRRSYKGGAMGVEL